MNCTLRVSWQVFGMGLGGHFEKEAIRIIRPSYVSVFLGLCLVQWNRPAVAQSGLVVWPHYLSGSIFHSCLSCPHLTTAWAQDIWRHLRQTCHENTKPKWVNDNINAAWTQGIGSEGDSLICCALRTVYVITRVGNQAARQWTTLRFSRNYFQPKLI